MTYEERMHAYYDAYNAEAPDRLGAMLAEDVELISAAGVQRGRDAYLATYRMMIGMFVDQMEPAAVTVEGDHVTVRITDRLTARANVPDFLGRSIAKGETIVLDLVGRYEFRGAEIARITIEPAT